MLIYMSLRALLRFRHWKGHCTNVLLYVCVAAWTLLLLLCVCYCCYCRRTGCAATGMLLLLLPPHWECRGMHVIVAAAAAALTVPRYAFYCCCCCRRTDCAAVCMLLLLLPPHWPCRGRHVIVTAAVALTVPRYAWYRDCCCPSIAIAIASYTIGTFVTMASVIKWNCPGYVSSGDSLSCPFRPN